ncbi:MAG: TonB-dependent receptor, partial [Methylococcaceae bacterium]|nr:TonB-dependent receptor [Methylococcaceae bacterium]
FSEQGNQNNPVLLGNKNLKPEIINTVEWAIDYRPVSSLRTAVNVYYYEIKDLIAAVPDVGKPSATFRNSGNQQGYGSEFEWNWQANEEWSVSGNYAWQHAINQQTHNRITYVPEHHVYVAVDWQFLPQWQLQPQINWIGGRVPASTDNRALQDYQTVPQHHYHKISQCQAGCFTLKLPSIFDNVILFSILSIIRQHPPIL